MITKTSSDVFIPISVGGGIKNIKDIEKILNAGADKVFINSAAIKKPKFHKRGQVKIWLIKYLSLYRGYKKSK